MKLHRQITSFTSIATFAIALAPISHAATITWGAPTNVSGDTDVMVAGSLVGAFNVGKTGVSSVTVNGVTFAPFAIVDLAASATVGNFNLAFPSGAFGETTRFGSTSAPFSSLSAPYKTLLQSGVFDGFSLITLTIDGLNIGTEYNFQVWANNAGNFTGIPQLVTATAGNSVTLDNNTSATNALGGVGQFVSGTFSANATSQVITFTSPDDFPEINAFQLRAVPEPSSLATLLIGGCMFASARRRKL